MDKGRKQCEASGQTSLDCPLSRAGGHDSTVPPEAGRKATSGLRRNLAVPKLGSTVWNMKNILLVLEASSLTNLTQASDLVTNPSEGTGSE